MCSCLYSIAFFFVKGKRHVLAAFIVQNLRAYKSCMFPRATARCHKCMEHIGVGQGILTGRLKRRNVSMCEI